MVFTIVKGKLRVLFKDAITSRREMLVLCKILKGNKQLPFAVKLEDRYVFIFSVASIFRYWGKS